VPHFFFQAEDGIRDKLVTGVQTCALPIFEQPDARRIASLDHRGAGHIKGEFLAAVEFRMRLWRQMTDEINIPGPFDSRRILGAQIGRASCRERVWISVVGGSWKRT